MSQTVAAAEARPVETDVERALLGALMKGGLWGQDAYRPAAAEVTPADFGDRRLGSVFALIGDMARRHEPITPVTVAALLPQYEVRGVDLPDLWAWIDLVGTPFDAQHHAELVRRSAIQRGLHQIADALNRDADGDPAVAMANAGKRLQLLRDDHAIQRLNARTLGDVLLEEDAYDWVIEDLIERGDRVMLTGSEGAGKSTIARQVGILAAAGIHPFTFFAIPPVRVLIVDAENSERQWRRASRPLVTKAAILGSVNPAEAVRLACTGPLDLTRDADVGQIHALLDEQPADLLIIGPLYRLAPRGGVTDDEDAAPLLRALDTIRARGCALFIEAHAGHTRTGDERNLRPRGSSALLGWPEFGLGLTSDKTANTARDFRLVRWRGDREARAWPVRLSREMSDWPWTATDWR